MKRPSKYYRKTVNLILQNVMPKAITEVYFELFVTNSYAQISCSRHSKFVKIVPILMHRIASAVFVYISFPASTKMFGYMSRKLRTEIMPQLSFVQRLQIANQKRYSDLNTKHSS